MGGWNAASQGWHRGRRERRHELSEGGRWTVPDVAALLIAFAIRWELGLAFLALKLWHQASGSPLSTLGFARTKWAGLVAITRGLTAGRSLPFSITSGRNRPATPRSICGGATSSRGSMPSATS